MGEVILSWGSSPVAAPSPLCDQCYIDASVTVVTMTGQFLSLTDMHIHVYGFPTLQTTLCHILSQWGCQVSIIGM